MISIPEKLVRAIGVHAEETYPRECCGAIAGESDGDKKRVRELWRATNTREDSPRNRFSIAPDEALAFERRAREQGLDILGYYHSHPDAPARPSAYDRDHAWPWLSYVIVSVRDGVARETTSWVVAAPDDPFEAERMEVL